MRWFASSKEVCNSLLGFVPAVLFRHLWPRVVVVSYFMLRMLADSVGKGDWKAVRVLATGERKPKTCHTASGSIV